MRFIDWKDHPVLENPNNAERRKHFCDERCMDLFVSRPCANCGSPVGVNSFGFHRQPANNPYYDGRVRARFCDRECREEWKNSLEERPDYVPASERPDPWDDTDAPVVRSLKADWNFIKYWIHFGCLVVGHAEEKKVVYRRGEPIGFRFDCDRCGATIHTLSSISISPKRAYKEGPNH